VYTNTHDWTEIRRRVFVEAMSKRAACRKFDLHWSTLVKILDAPSPPGNLTSRRIRPKLGAFLPVIDRILEADRLAPPKQRHIATRIYCRLRDEFGYRGGSSVVRDAVRTWKLQHAQVFMPLEHRPGDAQADFGTEQKISAIFEHEESATVGGRAGCRRLGAHAGAARHALVCAE
jgi:hypothetical protein